MYRKGKRKDKMGLSSSQARLLSLTGRMHDIEYKAQKLEAQKLQMANESAHVYQEYENALNRTKIQLKQMGSDGSIQFIDATYNNLLSSGYTIRYKGYEGLLVSQSQADNFVKAGNNKEYFIALETKRPETVDGYKEVYTAEQLIAALNTSQNNVKLRLMSDIDMSGKSFTSKDFSNSILDGNGHTISGLGQNLFNIVNNSTITNLRLDADINNNKSRGILANTINSSTIENISLTGSITYTGGSNNLGALTGRCSNTTINQVSTSVDVIADGINGTAGLYENTGIYKVGGLVGESVLGTITNCIVSGAEIRGGAIVGGLIGSSTSDIRNSTVVNSTITATTGNGLGNDDSTCGGFVGNYKTGTIESCSSENNQINSVTQVAGGFIGHLSDNKAIIDNCSSSSDVTIDSYFCKHTTPVELENDSCSCYAAEFIGMWTGGTINNSESSGTVMVKRANDSSYREVDYFVGTGSDIPGNLSGIIIKNCYNGEDTEDAFEAYSVYVGGINGKMSESSTTNITPPTAPSINVNVSLITEYPAEATLYDEMQTQGYYVVETFPHKGHEDDTAWLTNMLQEGYMYIYKKDKEGNLYQVNVATDTNLQEVSDDIELKKAEAKYEADMRKINNKDKKFDTDIAALEQERNAIKTEVDTLKSVAKDNVDRTFKLFS